MIGNIGSQLFELVKFVLLTTCYIIYYGILNVIKMCFISRLKSIENEIVLITGGGRGIGRELAFVYALEGATVIICDIDAFDGENTVQELNQLGYKAYFFTCDVSKYDDVFLLAKKIEDKIGNVTILINNAGVASANLLHLTKKTEIERVMNINAMAHFWTIQAFLPSMIKNKKGHIVAISSIAGLAGAPNAALYSASKFAVRGMMQGLSQENRLNKTNVQFTTILPYFADTKLFDMKKIRLPSFLPLLKPKIVAQKIMKAQQRNLQEVTVPDFLTCFLKIQQFFPQEVTDLLFDLYNLI